MAPKTGAKRMTTAKTSTQRKTEERQRHKKAGRVAVTVHVRPEFRWEVRALESRLRAIELMWNAGKRGQ